MAKIKFNLNFGGEQIRTLDDLRDNFSIEDVLDVYNNGLLVKWLDVHNHKNELEQVKAVQATDARGILTELIKIFGISDDPSEIEDSLSVLDYLEERKKVHEDMKAHGISDHEKLRKERDELARQVEELKELLEAKAPEAEIHEEAPKPAKKSYDDLVQEIIDNHQDLNHIYDCLDAITTDYPDILKEKYSELFDRLYAEAAHALYALFAHHATRPYYVLSDGELLLDRERRRYLYPPIENCFYGRDFQKGTLNNEWEDWKIKLDGYEQIEAHRLLPSVLEKLRFINTLNKVSIGIFGTSEFQVVKHPYLRVFSDEAHYGCEELSKWRVIETADKKFMLFHAYPTIWGNTAGTYTHHLVYVLQDFRIAFPVLNGIDIQPTKYKGHCFYSGFCYMEAR